jgi:hypothetical protein
MMGFSSGYRPPAYDPDENDLRYWIYAMKAFPMSPNSNELSMLNVRNYLIKACELVVDEILISERPESEVEEIPLDSKSEPEIRTTSNFWGENEFIPIKYLVPSFTLSVGDMLKRVPICAHLVEDQLGELVNCSETTTFEAGQVLFSEGDKANNVYLILSGKIKVYKEDTEGNEIELATLGKGSFFGETALFDKGIRSAAVKSLEECKFCVIEGDKFLDVVLE